MKLPSSTLIIALLLLIGAGGIVVYQTWPGEVELKGEEKVAAEKPQHTRPVKVAPKKEDPAQKWTSLTDHRLTSQVRLELARTIDADLSSPEIELLFEALQFQPEGQRPEIWWLVMNEIMEQMRKKGVGKDRLTGAFVDLIEDAEQPEVVRDYAVQHLSQWMAPRAGMPGETSPDQVDLSLQVIANVITDPSIAHTSIPGTALMSLTAASSLLSPEEMAPVWSRLDDQMTAMLKGEIEVPLSTKTTVIQSSAMRGSSTHLPLIQNMARNTAIDPSLRLSSIAALGIYRSEVDRDYLTNLSQGNSRYRYAAQAALKKLTP